MAGKLSQSAALLSLALCIGIPHVSAAHAKNGRPDVVIGTQKGSTAPSSAANAPESNSTSSATGIPENNTVPDPPTGILENSTAPDPPTGILENSTAPDPPTGILEDSAAPGPVIGDEQAAVPDATIETQQNNAPPSVILVGSSRMQKTTVSVGEKPGAHKAVDTAPSGRKGQSLGMFITTGYSSSEESTLTCSGTIPKARHTIAADLSLFPVGTKLMLNDIIYTVEDCGSAVIGKHIDIFYDTEEEASSHGKKTEEVFSVIE